MALKQAKRLLHLKTPLGEDLVLTGFQGFEGMSQLFQFELEMISDKADIAAKDIVAKPVTFSVRLADESLRHFNGIVNRFVAGDEDENGRRSYRAEVVPWFWFLTRNADCRVFEEKSIQEIMEQIFSDRGFSDHKIKLSGTHPKRQYCVQYRETDFDFLCRLMEEEGVWYTFTHEDGKHTMLISDSKNDYFDCEQQEVDYPTDVGSLAIEDHIRSWEHRYEFRSGKIAHSDYNVLNDGGDNFLQPSTPMDTDSETVVDLKDAKKYQLYDYPGIYTVKQEGTDFADMRMEAEEVDHDVVEGSGIVRAFTPGGKFKIRQHRAKSEEGNKFVLLTLSHTAQETEGYETGAPVDEGYHNSFTCIPDQINFRPACTTPKPSVHGVQSAIVVGDDEIPVDDYGRVKVRFPWLRQGKSDPEQSCWLRVSQNWAGSGWGGQFNPHKGQEVLVAFLDGNPDRPVIVGRVYNEEQQVPLDPARKEHLIINDKYGNEFNMKSDEGTISMICPSHKSEIHLGKSIEIVSSSNLIKLFGGNEDTHIEGDQKENVDGNSITDIVGDFTIKGGADITEFYVGIECKTTLGYRIRLVGGWKQEEILGKESKFIKGMKSEVILGAVYKVHKGVEYKQPDSGRKVKEPSLLQATKDCKYQYGKMNEIIKADKAIKVAGKQESKANDQIHTAKAMMKNFSNDMILRASAKAKMKAANMKIESAGQMKQKASTIKTTAETALIKATSIKLG